MLNFSTKKLLKYLEVQYLSLIMPDFSTLPNVAERSAFGEPSPNLRFTFFYLFTFEYLKKNFFMENFFFELFILQ